VVDRLDPGDGARHTVADIMTAEVLTAPPTLELPALSRRMVSGGGWFRSWTAGGWSAS
jgi:hypothetical protein